MVSGSRSLTTWLVPPESVEDIALPLAVVAVVTGDHFAAFALAGQRDPAALLHPQYAGERMRTHLGDALCAEGADRGCVGQWGPQL